MDENITLNFYNQKLINDLLSKGININDVNYKESPNYASIKDQRIYTDKNGIMTVEEYIERFLLKEEIVQLTYESIYDMGNTTELSNDDCTYNELSREIIDNLKLLDKEIQVEKKKLELELMNKKIFKEDKQLLKKQLDEKMKSFKKEVFDEKVKEFSIKFTRSGGLIERIKKFLNFDIKLFDTNNLKYQSEIFKILYFFYMIDYKYFPNINVLKLLSNQSMENADNSFFDMVTNNGRVIRFIKNQLEKELSLSVKMKIQEALSIISSRWNDLYEDAWKQVAYFAQHGYESVKIESINSFILKTSAINTSTIVKTGEYRHSPIETLYLKILQGENLGLIKDMLKLHDTQTKTDYIVPEEYIEEMKLLKFINIDDVETFIKTNASKIEKFIKSDLQLNYKITRIKKCASYVLEILNNYLNRANPLEKVPVTALLVISCLQAIMSDTEYNTSDNKYHGYANSSKSRKPPRVQDAIKKDKRTKEKNKRTPDIIKMHWERKIYEHLYANIGKHDNFKKLIELGKHFDKILEKIYEVPNVEGMLELHKYYLSK